MINPIKAFRQWRKGRRDAKLRLLSLSLANKYGGLMIETLNRSHVYYLYLKYGFSKDGVEVDEIFKRIYDEIPKFKAPESPLKP